MSKIKIFISRQIASDSPFQNLDEQQYAIHDQSLIVFSALPFEAPATDWLFFYSKNGVEFFFEKEGAALVPYKIACVGKATAEASLQFVQDVDFVGIGQPEEVAAQFSKVITKQESCCYIRAEDSNDSVRKLLSRPADHSLAVYRNSNIAEDQVPTATFHILVFTSPKNVEIFFACRPYAGERVLAIGTVTAAQLQQCGISNVEIAVNPSEKDLLHLVRK